MTAAELKEVVPKNMPVPQRPKKDEVEALEIYVTQELLNRLH